MTRLEGLKITISIVREKRTRVGIFTQEPDPGQSRGKPDASTDWQPGFSTLCGDSTRATNQPGLV